MQLQLGKLKNETLFAIRVLRSNQQLAVQINFFGVGFGLFTLDFRHGVHK